MRQNETFSAGLNPKQEQFILALLREKTKKEAARVAGITDATMYRYLADSKFIAA